MKTRIFVILLNFILISNAMGADPASLDEALGFNLSSGKIFAAIAGVLSLYCIAVFVFERIMQIILGKFGWEKMPRRYLKINGSYYRRKSGSQNKNAYRYETGRKYYKDNEIRYYKRRAQQERRWKGERQRDYIDYSPPKSFLKTCEPVPKHIQPYFDKYKPREDKAFYHDSSLDFLYKPDSFEFKTEKELNEYNENHSNFEIIQKNFGNRNLYLDSGEIDDFLKERTKSDTEKPPDWL